MSLFGGSGILGLGGTKVGDFFTNAVETIGGAAEDLAELKARAPNEIIEFGERLGGKTFDTSTGAGKTFKEEAIEFKSRTALSGLSKPLAGAVEWITNNLGIVIVGIVAFLIFRK